jgi:mutual gliding-motility protein MglA
VQLDFLAREITVKLVYYGPALSGKTTNLQALHEAVDPGATGRLMTLETQDDRTLFFDLLPLTFKGKGDVSIRVKVFTVPGQVIHASTRRLVVQGADGVVFVADSQVNETQHNGESFLDLKKNLSANGLVLADMPLVIQFNKQDLPNARTEEDLTRLAAKGKEPVYLAIATRGVGVVESFMGLLALTWSRLEQEHHFKHKFGIDGRGFLNEVAAKLGLEAGVEAAIGACVGGREQFERSGKFEL